MKGNRPGPTFVSGYVVCQICGRVVRPKFPPCFDGLVYPHNHKHPRGDKWCYGRATPALPHKEKACPSKC